MRTRRQGVMETPPEDKPVGLAVEAIKFLKEREQRLAADRARKAAMPVPNRICYAETAFKNWKPGMRIPPCKVCGDLLHPEENHVCSGFKPKYVEHDQDWQDRQDAKREEIREPESNRCPCFADPHLTVSHPRFVRGQSIRQRPPDTGTQNSLLGGVPRAR